MERSKRVRRTYASPRVDVYDCSAYAEVCIGTRSERRDQTEMQSKENEYFFEGDNVFGEEE